MILIFFAFLKVGFVKMFQI
nr:unnamed protein product [Callosobruchus analis]CAI5831404.1 unnamed protein product [Callosobruchus analis]